MKTINITNWRDGSTIFKSTKATVKEAAEEAVRGGVSLQGADLQGADLQGADLQRANLQDANLRRADLQGANLQGANLRRADLQDANLQGADLRRANLQGADLRRADLRRADLQRANLDFSSGIPYHCGGTGAKIDDRIFAQMIYHVTRQDFSGCSGGVKEAVEHIRGMAIANLFCEYRGDCERI